MPNVLADKRHQDLNCQLSEILHQYLLACDSLHDDPLADISNHLTVIQKAIIKCHNITLDYGITHRGGAK